MAKQNAKKKEESFLEQFDQFLSVPAELPLEAGSGHERLHDDHDGSYEGRLRVLISHDGDVAITTGSQFGPMLRFRSQFGGGRSPHIWNALRILAHAIDLDNELYPERPLPPQP
jgi:hypothetical protein